ncbi:uncharacterized protein LOC116844748 [Odontomachus brunneus]|uniref:uncharacterized protein LOC116844748 n=1 Tax=Odontomachus brunneus TaxID=486640 RepID=UPI0013F1BF48|nr:uncharacterized protein LOC116844748 [Odontomachus brunneus]XP_032672612.1 uncharacterized protein LOC116844748 [Odontomachus brunneus]
MSTRCQLVDDGKNELIHDEKIDFTETLAEMVDKLYINENTNCDVANKLVQKATIRQEITKSKHNFKKPAIPSYDIDGMSSQDLQVSLCRIKETPQQPFSFLANICEIFSDENQLVARAAKPSEIDIQLAAVAKRIESSRALLEEARSRVNKIHLRVKRDTAIQQQSMSDCTQNAGKLELEKQP